MLMMMTMMMVMNIMCVLFAVDAFACQILDRRSASLLVR